MCLLTRLPSREFQENAPGEHNPKWIKTTKHAREAVEAKKREWAQHEIYQNALQEISSEQRAPT